MPKKYKAEVQITIIKEFVFEDDGTDLKDQAFDTALELAGIGFDDLHEAKVIQEPMAV